MIEEIASHYEGGKLDSAVSVAFLGCYNTSHIETAREGVVEALGATIGNLDPQASSALGDDVLARWSEVLQSSIVAEGEGDALFGELDDLGVGLH